MVILHIACLNKQLYSGVRVVVPQHILSQGKYETAGLVNLNGFTLPEVENSFAGDSAFSLESLPEPFCHPDLVVFHEVYHKEYVKIAKMLRCKQIPYVIVPHGSLTKAAQKIKLWKKIPANILFFNGFIKGASGIQYLARNEQEETSFHSDGFVGTNGIVLPEIGKAQFSGQGVKFCFIGRLDVYHKGLDLLMKAIQKQRNLLLKENAVIKLYGPDYQGRHNQIRQMFLQYGIEGQITVNAPVYGEDKIAAQMDADIFVQTSRLEGMPMGILETLSYGLPCLVTRGTNLGELIEAYDAGWVAETDADSIAEQLEKAMTQRHLWEQKSQNARKLIAENFCWEQVAGNTIEQYRRIVVAGRK